jgi:uncharacterized protein YdaU (DUF1376 family)
MAGKDPAFLFYFRDWLVSTQLMSAEEKGMYIDLLCHQADKGPLSAKDMNIICKTYEKDKDDQSTLPSWVFDKFESVGKGKFLNKKLAETIERRRKYSESRRNNRLGKNNI